MLKGVMVMFVGESKFLGFAGMLFIDLKVASKICLGLPYVTLLVYITII